MMADDLQGDLASRWSELQIPGSARRLTRFIPASFLIMPVAEAGATPMRSASVVVLTLPCSRSIS